MKLIRLFIFALPLILVACQTADQETIATLRNMRVDIKEERIEGGIEKAMESYQRFLEETPDSALTPEAIRRLADLKIEREYGVLTDGTERETRSPDTPMDAPERAARPEASTVETADQVVEHDPAESEAEFERRATQSPEVAGTPGGAENLPPGVDDLERAGPLEAIELYKKLLNEYPLYERNDQVLYQMSRAYEELGRIEEAMEVMNQLVSKYPHSRYIDEVQFRRAEYFFTRKKYLDAEEAYISIVDIGVSSSYYELALYKLGWTFYKQELYEEALHRFVALLDYKVSVGYDFEQVEDETERKRLDDTFRVISLSFSYLGGADAVVDYFSRYGKRSYEHEIYHNLGEYFFDKRRYADATATYNAFVSRNPFHEKSPHFHMRVIEINKAGGFPTLVIDSKKEFATNYGLEAEYWQYFEPSDYPEVLGYLKTNLTDLANHYHALNQDPALKEEKRANFKEALHWYQEFLVSFPKEKESPTINYQMADLLLENKAYGQAAVEYEKTAYDYPRHERSAKAGYAAVYAYREYLEVVSPAKQDQVKREVVRSSLKFADTYPEHDKAAVVMGAAVDDLYAMEEHEQAVANAQKLIEKFPKADAKVLRGAWLVSAHSSYELERYSEAENAYVKVLSLVPPEDETRPALVDNLAASIYKQGEQAKALEDYRTAADHFLRVSRMAPTSKIRPTAEYDAAAALIQLKDWAAAATVLTGFRKSFPGHELQPEVTKKIAYVYKEDGKLALAAAEFERIERESEDDEVRQDALLMAAELHEETGNTDRALEVYRRYVGYFPQPVEANLETRNKIAGILKEKNDREGYLNELREIVAIDAAAGSARTDRTRYLAGKAGLVLAEVSYERFVEVKLVQPFEVNLRKKQELMKTATKQFGDLLEYQIGEVTAAATFYLAEIYAHFSKALMGSERPDGLSPLELEQYELAIEEQAYPFEEKAIGVHEKNLELISRDIYNEWVDKSLQKLAKMVPARYAKPEETSGIVTSLNTYIFELERPAPPAPPVQKQASVEEAKQEAQPAQGAPTSPPPPAEQASTETAPSGNDVRPEETREPARSRQPFAQTGEEQPVSKSGSSAGSEQVGEAKQGTVEPVQVKASADPGESESLETAGSAEMEGLPQPGALNQKHKPEQTAGAAETPEPERLGGAVEPTSKPAEEATPPAEEPNAATSSAEPTESGGPQKSGQQGEAQEAAAQSTEVGDNENSEQEVESGQLQPEDEGLVQAEEIPDPGEAGNTETSAGNANGEQAAGTEPVEGAADQQSKQAQGAAQPSEARQIEGPEQDVEIKEGEAEDLKQAGEEPDPSLEAEPEQGSGNVTGSDQVVEPEETEESGLVEGPAPSTDGESLTAGTAGQ